MRGSLPNNIARNGDTLEDDWPYLMKNDPIHSYNPLRCSFNLTSKQGILQTRKPNRYSRFGVAPPASKSRYAFLLHDLFIKPGWYNGNCITVRVCFVVERKSVIREN
jgi:type I restriction enzyme M protein